MEKEYYIKMGNDNYGPYTFAQVCSLGIFDTTFVSIPQDNSGWKMAKDIQELQGFTVTEETMTLQSPEDCQFFLREGASIYGPYTIEEFAYLDIKEGSFVGVNGTRKWYLAESISGLLPLLDNYKERILQQANQTETPQEELYYVSLEGENFGPFDLSGMREFGLFNSTLVRKYNENFWRIAETLPELQGYTIPEPTPEPIPEPVLGPTPEPTSEPVPEPIPEPVPEPIPTIVNSPDTTVGQSPMLYDLSEDLDQVYGKYKDEILQVLTEGKDDFRSSNPINHTNYSEEVFEMAIWQYSLKHSALLEMLRKAKKKCEAFEAKYNEDSQRLNNLYLQKTVVEPSLHQPTDLQQITAIDERRRLARERYEETKSEVLRKIRSAVESFYMKNPLVFNERYEIAPKSESRWHNLTRENRDVQKRFYLGEFHTKLSFFGETISVRERKYPVFLNGKHLVLHYDQRDKQLCLDIVNTLLGRALMAVPSGGLLLSMIDAKEMDGTGEEWKQLNRRVIKISARSADIMKVLDETVLHIEHIIQNLLTGQNNLVDYNANKENQEPYRILIIEDYPVGIPMEGINQLKKILRNGIRAGVTVVLMNNEDEIKRSEDALKAFRMLDLELFKDDITQLYWPKKESENAFLPFYEYDLFSDDMLRQIVNSVNKGFEVKTETVLNLMDYLPDRKDWWTGVSASMVEIPFGMSTTKNISQLRITQESGQNSAVVIGIPGSGKSVFLHSIILDSAIKYSPDELQMYLLDFSGVEFNVYANHSLPHARVIAPEAEREFGLSVLRELKEEGARRMTLCRENEVTSIVQYRNKNPEAIMPRLLVIIDEFQKIFEVENDAISKEANSIIHIIIQEYRKFGINLVLATQRIPSSSVLPRDLIANRVVFKSAPNDFSALVSWQGNMMPNLKTGQCIYNAESGAVYANEQAQGFYIPMHDIEKLLDELEAKGRSKGYVNKNLIVFRGNDLPDFKERRLPKRYMVVQDIPEEVPVCLGQSIAISDTDVCAVLRKESTNNLLIIGGEKDVAQKLMLHAALSTTLSHTSDSASFYLFNFMRPTDPQYNLPAENFEGMPFPVKLVEKMSEVKDVLTEVKNEIDARKQDETKALTHIYLNFFAFQLGRVFDRGGRRGDDVSEEGQLLDCILRHGPAYGVFTLLQVDKTDGLARIGTPIPCFTHRVVMQISENESIKLMDSPLGNRLFVMSRPSSKFRAFYRDQNRNVTIKFKPYK